MVTHYSSSRFVSIAIRSLAMAVSVAMSGISGFEVYADEPANHPAKAVQSSRLKLKPDRVIVFKDGYCLVVKQAVATTDADGNVFTGEVPDAAVLGSFWAVPEKGTIRTTIAGWVNTESTANREISCTSIIEIIKSNLGKECSFAMGQQQIEGMLLKILSNDDTPIEDSAFPHDSHQAELLLTTASIPAIQSPTTTISSVTGAWFLVRTRAGDKMIQANSVSDLTIEDMNSSIEQTVTTRSRHKRLTMKFGEANTDIKLNLMYFRPDVRWIPTYLVNLTGPPLADKKNDTDGKANDRKKAELIMQGEILNEAEDFVNVPFHVVVGVPILRTEVTYRDIYTWDIELTHSESYAATTADSPSPLILSETKVWRQVELINKTESVPVEVRLRFGGKATKASDDGKITRESFRTEDWRDNRGNPINNSSVVRWTTTVLPGECFKPVVNYEFLLQH